MQRTIKTTNGITNRMNDNTSENEKKNKNSCDVETMKTMMKKQREIDSFTTQIPIQHDRARTREETRHCHGSRERLTSSQQFWQKFHCQNWK